MVTYTNLEDITASSRSSGETASIYREAANDIIKDDGYNFMNTNLEGITALSRSSGETAPHREAANDTIYDDGFNL